MGVRAIEIVGKRWKISYHLNSKKTFIEIAIFESALCQNRFNFFPISPIDEKESFFNLIATCFVLKFGTDRNRWTPGDSEIESIAS